MGALIVKPYIVKEYEDIPHGGFGIVKNKMYWLSVMRKNDGSFSIMQHSAQRDAVRYGTQQAKYHRKLQNEARSH